MDATARLGAFCSGLDGSDLDETVETAAVKALVDTLAACYAGVDTAAGEAILAYLDAAGAPGDGTVVGTSCRAHPGFAALVNGTTAHALDADDGHRAASAHPGSPTIPAALAVAEREGVTGRDLLTAIVAGYETIATVGTAVQPSHRTRGFHATGTVGCFGAAAAAASLLDLPQRETTWALGLAGTQAGGLFEFLDTGSMAKRFHPGRAAMAGVLAADLAAAGYDGPETIIEGNDGFARAYADASTLRPFKHLGDPFAVTQSYLKPYPCCRHIHAPIDAVLESRDQIDVDEIESIRVETYETAAYHDKTAVSTLLDAQMSIPYGVAVTLLEGTARLGQFDPPRDDVRIHDLMDRTAVVATDAMADRYPDARPARVVVETSTGTERALVEYPRGAPENPLSEAAVRAKFHDFADDRLDEDGRDRFLDSVFDIGDVDDLSELFGTLAAPLA